MSGLMRGANVALTKEIPGLRTLVVGAAWDAGGEHALDDNLVLAAVLCGPDGRATSADDFVFFQQVVSSDLSVAAVDAALGDDTEQLEIDLDGVPAAVERVVVVLYLSEGGPRRRTLGQLKRCVVRVLDGATGAGIVSSEDLAPGFGPETAVVLGEVYRHQGGWKFKVVGQGYAAGIVGVAEQYGLPL
ncbi:TerD family protein [Luteimicrobium sp. DT211]|uniref:TerD family protein n=1 Tax=Luteimicrobium sp. DT211 TaxID=3393412 RepID=UPI003CFA8A8A